MILLLYNYYRHNYSKLNVNSNINKDLSDKGCRTWLVFGL